MAELNVLDISPNFEMEPASMNQIDSKEVIRLLDMKPHPEGGFYVETFRDDDQESGLVASTAIYYLLEAGDCSHWHRVLGSSEIWHHYGGGTLVLSISEDGDKVHETRLGVDLAAGERPQVVVPSRWWQSAKCLDQWTLVGCTVAPGFDFKNFEMAPPDWKPASQRIGSQL